MDVVVVRSARRRKTVEAREVGGKIVVSIPARMTKADERRHVELLVARLERRRHASEVDLEERARTLAARYALRRPASIRWVDNQEKRWGSCTPSDGAVRISSRLAAYPPWVVDYVIVHELAHLDGSGHTPAFWARVDRYPKAERARGFLIAKGMGGDDHDGAQGDEGGSASEG
jgi:predicted metal-dependent hydrolase